MTNRFVLITNDSSWYFLNELKKVHVLPNFYRRNHAIMFNVIHVLLMIIDELFNLLHVHASGPILQYGGFLYQYSIFEISLCVVGYLFGTTCSVNQSDLQYFFVQFKQQLLLFLSIYHSLSFKCDCLYIHIIRRIIIVLQTAVTSER